MWCMCDVCVAVTMDADTPFADLILLQLDADTGIDSISSQQQQPTADVGGSKNENRNKMV